MSASDLSKKAGGAGAIRDLSKEAGAPGDMSVDVLVIGSGPAGATAARVLAEKGREVLVLEEGPDRTGDTVPSHGLTQRDGEMYDQLYMDRGGRSTSDLSVSVLQGRALGGGGIVNASDVVPMKHDVMRFWQRKHGLADYGPERLEPFQALALEDLHANQIGEDQLNLANKLLRLGAQKIGVKGEVMLHNRLGCAGLGTCLIGCPLGAKKNPRWVSIPKAVAAGAVFLCRARAVRVVDVTSEQKRVMVATLDERGYHEQHSFTIKAKTVILAANAVGSAHLAVRSGFGNEHAGRHLSLQPQLPVVARFAEDVIAYRGIPQAYAITDGEYVDDERGLWGFRVEAIMGTPGIVASLLPRVGTETKTAMLDYNKLVAALVLVPDTPVGVVSSTSSGKVKIDYALADDNKARMRAGAKVAARAYLAAGAREVEIPLQRPVLIQSESDLAAIDTIPFDPCTAPLLSAHQQGGMRASSSSKTGACDPTGLVYGTQGVYVFDSGLFPSSASSHTQTPIITIARMLATQLT